MKKIFIVLSVFMVCSLIISSCAPQPSQTGFVEEQSQQPQEADQNLSQNQDSTDDLITLSLWHYYGSGTKEVFDELIGEYNETVGVEKGVLIDAYSYSGVSELAQAVSASANREIGAEDMPDIFASYSDDAYNLDVLGVIAALDEYFSQSELDVYRAEFLEEGRFDAQGNLKIVPVAKSTEILYINEVGFNEFAGNTGVTVADLGTWEGLADVAEKYYDWSGGETFFGIDAMANMFNVCSAQLGTPIFTNENGVTSYTLSEQSAKMIWDYIYVPYVKGYYGEVGRFRSDDMTQGYIMAYSGSTSGAGYFPQTVELSGDEKYDTSCLTVPYPTFDGAQNIMIQQGAGMVVSKSDTQREQAAVDFLKWFTSEEINTRFAVATGYMPVVNSAINIDNILPNIDGSVPAVLATSQLVYDIIDDYELYAPKPFEGSSDARSFVEDSFRLRLADDLAAIESGAKTAQDAISEDSFNEWYTDFSGELSAY